MKIVILAGIVAFFAISIWYAKRNGVKTQYKAEPLKVSTNKDQPLDFGYKMVWIAVKSGNIEEIADAIGLNNRQPANWASGIESAYDSSIYITPQIGEWTLVIGGGLDLVNDSEDTANVERLLNTLSTKFGEAQFFATHRVVEYHVWMKSRNGKMERVYAYVGESGKNIKVYGELTEPEIGLNLFNSFSKEAELEDYWERENIVYADEELVMTIAENWSVNPTKLSERTDIKDELGLIGN